MLEGSHGMARDADAAMALLEEKVKDGDAKSMWMLGVCCEFGMGTKQDVDRAEQLYKHWSRATAKLLTGKLKNEWARHPKNGFVPLARTNNKNKDWCIK